MYMYQDWLMRQIESMAAAIARLFFGKGEKQYDLKEVPGQKQADELKRQLRSMLDEGRLGEAEDLLFDRLDAADRSILAVALDFYQQANTLSDDSLEAQGFTRMELWEGLGDVAEWYGLYLPGFWE